MRFVNLVVLATCVIFSCAHENNKSQKHIDHKENSLKNYYSINPAIKHYINKAVAYVIFPRIEKGAVGVGGAYGKGTY